MPLSLSFSSEEFMTYIQTAVTCIVTRKATEQSNVNCSSKMFRQQVFVRRKFACEIEISSLPFLSVCLAKVYRSTSYVIAILLRWMTPFDLLEKKKKKTMHLNCNRIRVKENHHNNKYHTRSGGFLQQTPLVF